MEMETVFVIQLYTKLYTMLEKNWIVELGEGITPLCQYFVEPPFALITAFSSLGYVSINLAHLDFAIFASSFLLAGKQIQRLTGL